MLIIWLAFFNFAVQYDFTRKILQQYPDICSANMFKDSGPTREQAKQVNVFELLCFYQFKK